MSDTVLEGLVNHQVRLAARPVGLPQASDWQHATQPVTELADGGVLVKTLMLSLDPAMRGWMNEGKSYIPPVGIGEVMRARAVGRVIASNDPGMSWCNTRRMSGLSTPIPNALVATKTSMASAMN